MINYVMVLFSISKTEPITYSKKIFNSKADF